MCDKLVVGVTVDELVQYKGKRAMIPFEDRIELVRSCIYVDAAVPQYDMDKLTAAKNWAHHIFLLVMIGMEQKNGKNMKRNFRKKV